MSSTKQSESTDFDWAVRPHRIVLKACGIWPKIYQNPWKNFLMNLNGLIGLFAILASVTLPGMYGLYLNRYDLLGIVDNLQYAAPIIGTVAKYLDVWVGRKALAAVVQEMSDDWTKPKNSEEQDMMISQAKLCRKVFKVTSLIMGTTSLVLISLPIMGVKLRYNLGPDERPLIVPSQFFFDVNVSPNYEIVYFAQAYAMGFTAVSYSAIDNFIVLVVLHIRGQLRNLRSRMLMMSRSKNFQLDLIANVEDHIRLTRMIGNMDSIFNRAFAVIFLYFAISTCMNSLMILYLIMSHDDIPVTRLIFIIMILFTNFSHAALYCIVGEILVIELEEIYNAICASDWEDLKPHDARKLILVMVYTSRPIYLTAAKIVPVNMTTFCKILRMTGSYVSFLFAKVQ